MRILIKKLLIISIIFISSARTFDLVCVTGNDVKYSLFKELIERYFSKCALIKKDLILHEIQGEPEEVIKQKAVDAWKIVKQPCIVDDSGFELEAVPGFPGAATKLVMSKIGLKGLFQFCEMKKNYRLTVYSYIGYCDNENSDDPKIFRGEACGSLINPAYDFSGRSKRPEFWYDYFIPEGSEKTYGQLFDDGELESFNYRARALNKFLEWFITYKK